MAPDELKSARLAMGYTQQELARILRVNRRTVGKWELGKARMPFAASEYVKELLRLGKK